MSLVDWGMLKSFVGWGKLKRFRAVPLMGVTMESVHLDVPSTLRDRRFLALLAIALLVTYALPFPIINDVLQDYSRLKGVMERMAKENDATVCHRVLSTNPDFFSSHGMRCDEEYYRPNESTVTTGDLIVYEDTYREYLRAREALKRDLPALVLLVIFAFLAMLGFGYAMIDFAVGVSTGDEKGVKDTLLSGLRAVPTLAVSEFLVSPYCYWSWHSWRFQ